MLMVSHGEIHCHVVNCNLLTLQARPGESGAEREARLQREQMRRERKREREREMRLEVLGKKTKTMRDRDRDITEKIALGMHTSNKLSGEAMFDQRLFNQVHFPVDLLLKCVGSTGLVAYGLR